MEMYNYQCHVCSFAHSIPAYWTSFSPEKETEMIHLNLETNEICPCNMLQFMGKENI